ncbi:Chaperone protein DnaK [bioreactor metagenome]|uniref:Chaperone protein DnaK n=1 Tax=bioreactor metagenome TaxID=1076179 RepID=A0A644Y5D3_9ZZZZ
MVYQAEKQLKELGDKVDPALKSDLESDIARIKKLLEANDTEALKSAASDFEQKLMKLGEELYKQQAAGAAGQAAGQNPGAAPGAEAGGKKSDDGVVDAEVVD